ncbi:hypothetical protein G4Y79_03715 [Phototrophicus methaneseepsis]|uniref:Uncharacterized protein n=1 Tax=Phototrophicus methaneseepsis TaxID=2710758 RepID=A0A7S8EAS2_9CHLR|nr:hypothetical protein [Phototrophicus methaneseepsis]QPC83501.1 hypothetical protein G4Y79_03715 [Phototrophicus methaneseepsis]
MASIPQSTHIQNTYQYATSMLQAGKSPAAVKETLIANGLSDKRAQAILDNIHNLRRSSFYHFVRLHPLLHRVEVRLRGMMKH